MARPSDAPEVFRGVARDGTVVFSDRPSRASGPGGQSSSYRASPLAVNVLASTPVVDPQPPPAAAVKAKPQQAPAPATNSVHNCDDLRQQLATLWRERRSGYSVQRSASLKKAIRERQHDLKLFCGHWR